MPKTTNLALPKELWEAPPNSTVTPSTRPFVYDHIPQLSELLPQFRGRPGFVYAQVTNQNLRRAQDESWRKVEGTVIYTIIGPKGEADMELMVRGGLIPGQSPDSGARLCVVDQTVEELTGLTIPVLWKETSPTNTPTTPTKEPTNVRGTPKDGQASNNAA